MIKCENCKYYYGETVIAKDVKHDKDISLVFTCNATLCPNIDFRSKRIYKEAMLTAMHKERV